MKRQTLFIHVFTLLLFLLAAVELIWPEHLLSLDGRLSDLLVRVHAKNLQADPDIVIVNIDDYSLAAMDEKVGKMPWPRLVHGELAEAIYKQKPKAIVFDLTFNEKDRDRPDSDAMFNEKVKGKSNIFYPITSRALDADSYVANLSKVQRPLGLIKTAKADPFAKWGFLLPFALDMESWQVGTVNFSEDRDGVGRRYALYTNASGWLIPSLPAKVASNLHYPVPQVDDMILSWRGDEHPYQRIAYADVYADIDRKKPQRDPHEFANKIVIIGSDASSMNDLRVTPINSLYGGVDILATAIDNLKNQRMMQVPPRWQYATVTLLLMALIYVSFLLRWNAFYPALILAVLTPLSIASSYIALSHLIMLHVLAPLIFVWTYYFALALREYMLERKSRQEAVQFLGRFVNEHVAAELMAEGGITRGGESREITVLFSDIRGFTSLSENRTPQEIVELLNRYFSLQVEVIFRHNGTLDKFIGDCIMAFWGAPKDNPNHALDAVKAAIEMTQVLNEFKAELGALGEEFDVGIGLHSGSSVVGIIGPEQKSDYTAIGDTVNLASRIEGLTKGVSRILISRETMLLCGDALDFVAFGSYKVKGREQEVELFAPVVSESTANA